MLSSYLLFPKYDYLHPMRKLITLLMITALLAGCSESGIKDKRPVLMVSIDPYRYFIDQISGGRFRAVSLVPRTSNPESYEPTAQQMLDLMNSRAYLSSGYLDFEKTRLKQITDENPHFLLFNLANGIKTLRDSDGNGADPHVWLSAQNAEIIAKNICSALCRIDSANSKEYKERTEKFTQHIDSIDRQIQSLTGNLVHRTFVIYHPALTYFAKDYGLRQLPVCTGGKEASPAHIKTVISQSRAEKAEILFIQEQFPSTTIKQIARESGTEIVEINPLAYQWDEEMITIAKSLAK